MGSYHLANGCKLVISHGDLTKWRVNGKTDAIVNAANEGLLGAGGVDGCIHDAAGHELFEHCIRLPPVAPGSRCLIGDAVVTPGFKLPVPKIIHTVGPWYESPDADNLLARSYVNSLAKAREEGVKYIAFPAVSCGLFRFPVNQAALIALSTCKAECSGFQEIHFVLFDRETWQAWKNKAEQLNLEKIKEEAPKRTIRRFLGCFHI